MKTEELNNLMVDVTNRLNEAECEYFLSVMAKDDEAVLGSASINMNDVDAAAKLISQSIEKGGAYGQRMLALFGKVFTNLKVDLSAYDVKDRNVPHDKQQEETPKAFRR